MTRKTLFISFLVLLSASFFSCGRHGRGDVMIQTDSLFLDLNKEIVSRRARMADKVFTNLDLNGVVLYAEQGQVIYEKAFGWRDLSKRHKDSLRIDDAFQLSSDSKMFTAEAIMLLKAEGKLDYDDDVRKYIPELPYEGITIRQLLTHRSGLPRYDAMADKHWPSRRKPFSNDAMIKMMAEKTPKPYNAPDAVFFYNNVNYALLGSVVERVSGQHFEDFMRERIFEPLGMAHTFIYSVEVHGHDMYKKGPVKARNDYLNGVMGDKIMFSTVEDLYKFNLALDHHQLLPDSLQAEAFKPGSPIWKNKENYGFGWRMSRDYPDAYFHFGWWKGYRSLVIRDAKHRRFLAILTNTTQLIPVEETFGFVEDTTVMLPPYESWPKK